MTDATDGQAITDDTDRPALTDAADDPVVTDDKPASARRSRTPWRAAFFALAGLGIVAGVAWALLGSRLLVVKSVTVTGTHLVTPAQVLAAADVPLGTSLVGVNAGQVTQRVEAIRQVASATVAKEWPDHLVIRVRERVPVVAVRMAGGGYDLLDASGVIVRWSPKQPARLPQYLTPLTGGELQGDPALAAAAAVLTELSPKLSAQVTTLGVVQALTGPGVTPAEAYQVLLTLRDHKTVLWGGTDHASVKNRELTILVRSHGRYFDVSAPGTVVTR
ncbi:MAG TPA: FtsQ-type POTRA domain-containing protein [Trebonia sp.]|jgi:cell division protein FtsQ